MEQRSRSAAGMDAQIAKKGGVCIKHGAKRTCYDESTAFGSEYEKDTAGTDPPHQNTADALDERSTSTVPGEVLICQEVVEV